MPKHWKHWNPGLENGDMTLQEVLASLPGAKQEDISLLVRMIENPDSPFALPGAITLAHHDCVHILLGRGLLNQDEAFVIGFTMGTSKKIKRFQEYLFKQVAKHLYPKSYRFTKEHLKAYALGLREGKASRCERIYEFPFEQYNDWKLKDLRTHLGIETARLKKAYAEEKMLLPDTTASKRLLT